ncbi:hypothetical protein K9F62_15225 [Desulfovibrio sp. JY]|nr:hypothetical protein K9F62_15225 [Desulfovibrio sp. JY]
MDVFILLTKFGKRQAWALLLAIEAAEPGNVEKRLPFPYRASTFKITTGDRRAP